MDFAGSSVSQAGPGGMPALSPWEELWLDLPCACAPSLANRLCPASSVLLLTGGVKSYGVTGNWM